MRPVVEPALAAAEKAANSAQWPATDPPTASKYVSDHFFGGVVHGNLGGLHIDQPQDAEFII
jgi:hypothetical protein